MGVMETYYTIIKIAPNPISGDTLSIGLLLCNNEKYYVRFSEEKKRIVQKCLPQKLSYIDYIIKQITQVVEEAKNQKNERNRHNITQMLNHNKINYLNTYCNGLLRFSEPIPINDDVTQDKFDKLFRLLIDSNYQMKFYELDTYNIDLENNFQARIYNNLIEKVKNRVHTSFEITPELLPGLYYNFNIDCIGKNGSLVGAKSIPFHKKYETIDKELSHYFSFISIIKSKYKHNGDDFYIIGDEPSNIDSREHRTWESINNFPNITLINSEQSGIVADKIESKNATSFLTN